MSEEPSSQPAKSAAQRGKVRTHTKLLLLLTSSLILLGVAEVGARLYAHATMKVRGSTYHAEYGWKPMAGIEKVGAVWCDQLPARTNSHGWRDRETPYEKPKGVRRIVTLGDSFTFGHGLDYGNRFSEQLETGWNDLDVVNLGVFGFGTDQELRVFEVEGARYQPDVVVLGMYLGNDLDDIRDERRFGWPKPYYRLPDNHLELVRPKINWEVRFRLASYLIEFGFQKLGDQRQQWSHAPEWETADTIPLFRKLILALARRAEEANAKLLVMLIHPRDGENRGPSVRNTRVLSILAENGIAALDTYEAFSPDGAPKTQLYQPDGHWNAAGNRVAAELLSAELLQRGWL